MFFNITTDCNCFNDVSKMHDTCFLCVSWVFCLSQQDIFWLGTSPQGYWALLWYYFEEFNTLQTARDIIIKTVTSGFVMNSLYRVYGMSTVTRYCTFVYSEYSTVLCYHNVSLSPKCT